MNHRACETAHGSFCETLFNASCCHQYCLIEELTCCWPGLANFRVLPGITGLLSIRSLVPTPSRAPGARRHVGLRFHRKPVWMGSANPSRLEWVSLSMLRYVWINPKPRTGSIDQGHLFQSGFWSRTHILIRRTCCLMSVQFEGHRRAGLCICTNPLWRGPADPSN